MFNAEGTGLEQPQIPSGNPIHFPSNRGPSDYFHGRKEILDHFDSLLWNSRVGRDGTIFAVQGAPWSGKTALVHECIKLADASGWEVVKIRRSALYCRNGLWVYLPYIPHDPPYIPPGTWATGREVFIRGMQDSSNRLRKEEEILRNRKMPVLLVWDEAQLDGDMSTVEPEYKYRIARMLELIFHGALIRPVVLLVAGLGVTRWHLKSYGIEKLRSNCFFELQELSKEETCALIKDWLITHAGAHGNPEEWISLIQHETGGWPYHIMAYVTAAIEHLQKSDGEMTPDGLADVIHQGRESCQWLYHDRIKPFKESHLCSIAAPLASIPLGSKFYHKRILVSLENSHGRDEASDIFREATRKGIFCPRGNLVTVPIPGMHAWLVDNYYH